MKLQIVLRKLSASLWSRDIVPMFKPAQSDKPSGTGNLEEEIIIRFTTVQKSRHE